MLGGMTTVAKKRTQKITLAGVPAGVFTLPLVADTCPAANP